ncbi:MAG: proline dehydrogenase family protein, partial [Dissulfurispiraceae bacterium]
MSCREGHEKKIRETALQLHELMGVGVPSFFNPRRWQGRLMAFAMRDENFKVKLFRFVDLLPALKEDALIAKMLNEYFSEFEDAPLILRQGIKRISGNGILTHIAAGIIGAAVKSLAGQFILGGDIVEAAVPLEEIRKKGFSFSIDLLGEEVLGSKEEMHYTARYLELLVQLGKMAMAWQDVPLLDRDDMGPIPRFDISIKASSLYSQLDPADWQGSVNSAKARLGPIIDKANYYGASVTFDMERYYNKGLIIAIFREILQEHKEFHFGGIALQAYLRETRDDLLRLIEWAKTHKRRVTVRLVKGAYWDYETVINQQNGWPLPVFMHKEETDRNFEEITGILFENTEYIRPAIATHNIRSISHAMTVADSLNLPRAAFEFQMIYGMADQLSRALQAKGYRVRLYAPAGELIPGMAYLIRRLLENTVNVSFLRRSFFEQESIEELTKAPLLAKDITTALQKIENQEVQVFRNEPFLDFSLSENRESMKAALERVRAEFGEVYPLVIGDRQIMKEKKIISINPARPEEVVGCVSSGSKEDAEKAVLEARLAWSAWKKTPADERAEYLFRSAEVMRKKRFELAALEVYEVGKPWKEADADVSEAIDYLEYYGREMIRLGVPRLLGDYPGEENEYTYEPKGVGAVISPWNFPLAIPAGMVSAA